MYCVKKTKQYLGMSVNIVMHFFPSSSDNEFDHDLLSDNNIVLALPQKHEVELNIHG